MVMEFPDDPLCHTLDKQYMLGDSLLVAPIFNEEGNCNVYLPEGKFTNFFTGEAVEGGKLIKGNYSYMELPVFVPENSLIAMGQDDTVDYEYHENITIRAYHVTDQTINLYDKKGTHQAKVTVKLENGEFKLTIEGNAPNITLEVID